MINEADDFSTPLDLEGQWSREDEYIRKPMPRWFWWLLPITPIIFVVCVVTVLVALVSKDFIELTWDILSARKRR